jgi:TonB family protein
MLSTPGRRLAVLFASLFVVGATAASSPVQESGFVEPVPETTVDAKISPLVFQGGTIVVRVKVAADGRVASVDVIKGFPALTEPVVRAVRDWRFRPARLNGRPVEASTTVAVQIVIIRNVVPE